MAGDAEGAEALIHYHGTPITPHAKLAAMAGRHFCVSHDDLRDLSACLKIGASVMMDNGAFSAWTRNRTPDWPAFYRWAAEHLQHPHWAVVPDVIAGGEAANDELLAQCPLPREWSAPVWHLHESLDRLARLSDLYARVCFGSSGEFRDPGTPAWTGRIDQAWDMLERTGRRPWVHMLRAMREASSGPWPFGSADSTNIARNHSGSAKAPSQEPEMMARRIDALNPRRLGKRALQGALL